MRTNIFVPASKAEERRLAPTTHEGAPASVITPVQELRRSVMANMLWEDSFYESGVDIATRIQDTVSRVLAEGKGAAKRVADIAYEARTQMKLRHVPLLLLASLIKSKDAGAREIIADVIPHVIQRPDETGELISIYWKLNGKRTMLTAQMKKGLAQAFKKFNEFSLAKYNRSGDAIRLRDVLFLVHAKPDTVEQAELWERLIADKLEVPDTWEVQLSAGKDKQETFTRLLKEEKLGALALLRNLRNMTESGVDIKLIREGLHKLNPERVLPFRFITAARYATQLEPELEHLMLRCLNDVAKLPGRTALLVDNSGSMYHSVSAKSELQRADAAAGLAILLREICVDPVIFSYSSRPVVVPPRRGFALRDIVQRSTDHGSTDTALAVKIAGKTGYDRIIVITDEQSATKIDASIPGTKAYIINVAAYQNGIGYDKWVHIDGWSEAVVDYIRMYEQEGK